MTDTTNRDVFDTAEGTLTSMIEDIDVHAKGVTFDTPWQARAFAIAVALCEEGSTDWKGLQERFIERIEATDPETMQEDVERVYFEQWLAALEDLLDSMDLVATAELDARQAEFEEGERDESEFVLTDLPERIE